MNWGMAMTDWNAREHTLDDLFAAARRAAPEPSPGFLARVIADAEAVQEAAEAVPVRRSAAPSGGLMAALRGMFGGWGALGGMLTATVAGIWIGFSGADQLGLVTGGLLGTTESLGTVSLLPEGDIFALAVQE